MNIVNASKGDASKLAKKYLSFNCKINTLRPINKIKVCWHRNQYQRVISILSMLRKNGF